MAIGRPINLTANVSTKTINATATSGQTSFTVTGGYRVNNIGVYRNGVRLVDGRDYSATDGSTVILEEGATTGDVLDFHIFDSFNVADQISGNAPNQTIDGNLTVTGTLLSSGGINTTSNVGFGTTRPDSIARSNNSVILNTGIVTAYQLYGDGSNLTGLPGQKDFWVATAAGINTTVSVGIGTTRPDSIARVNNTKILNVGILTAYQVNVSGMTSVGDVVSSGIVTADSFYGDGSNLSGISTAAVPGISTQLHSVFGTVNASGIVTAATMSGTDYTGNFVLDSYLFN